ncbi:hypothetical protein CI109_107258 [Kwoniella shandongensis]|uniref:Uncharacterized protein n=1 Tax=Kwoniella shandongensis TaxID=1734106 RepID=A0AAJ8N0H9_9TREE
MSKKSTSNTDNKTSSLLQDTAKSVATWVAFDGPQVRESVWQSEGKQSSAAGQAVKHAADTAYTTAFERSPPDEKPAPSHRSGGRSSTTTQGN